ncbi:MAG TPA: hypothetical protein VF846_17020 [Thermoanaerobaculia bacterium]|jgi:hypothetical protein
MSRTIEISAVPDELHDALVARAEQEGVSISELVLRQLEKQVSKAMEPGELLERLRRIPPVDLANLTAADLIRERDLTPAAEFMRQLEAKAPITR